MAFYPDHTRAERWTTFIRLHPVQRRTEKLLHEQLQNDEAEKNTEKSNSEMFFAVVF